MCELFSSFQYDELLLHAWNCRAKHWIAYMCISSFSFSNVVSIVCVLVWFGYLLHIKSYIRMWWCTFESYDLPLMRFEHACLAFFTTFRCKTDSLTSSSSIHIDWNIHCMNRSKTIIIHFILGGLKITENWDIFSLSLYLSPFDFRWNSIVRQSKKISLCIQYLSHFNIFPRL